jgi:tetratricopeptide (TPR) repeat protein
VSGWRTAFLGVVGLALSLVLLGSPAAQEKGKPGTPGPDGAKAPDAQMQAEAHYELGVMYHERVFESLDQAIAEYEKAVKLKPEYAEAHFNLALSYHTKAKLGTDDRNLYRKALAEYKLYLKYNPNGELAGKAKQNIKAVEARLRP